MLEDQRILRDTSFPDSRWVLKAGLQSEDPRPSQNWG